MGSMNLDQFISTYNGKSVLYAANPSREYLRGQCVQLACFWVSAIGKPVIWDDAYKWWSRKLFPEHYQYIENTETAVPQPGDLIVWDASLANSGGAGHIAVCVTPKPGTGTFVSFDSNWGGKTAHLVTHNYTKVVGWLRPKVAAAPAPAAPAPQTQGDEMIANTDQAAKIYKMLRPNGGASDGEINGTAGHRSFAGFLNDAQPEIAARDANLRAQAQHMVDMQNTINQLNQTVTNVTADDAADKQQVQDALAKVGQLTAQLETSHDELVELQKKVPTDTPAPTPAAGEPNIVVRIIAALLRTKKQ